MSQTIRRAVDPESVHDRILGVILAGGKGTRLQSVRSDCPKPLIPCAGLPFIEWVIRWFHKEGVSEFVVSLGHLSEVAQSYFDQRPNDGVTISTVVEPSPLGTGGAVRFVGNQHPGRSLLVVNGDSLLIGDFSPLWNLWQASKCDGIIVGLPQADASRYGTLSFTDQGRLLSFDEKRSGGGVINAGIYLLRPRLIATIPEKSAVSLERDVFPDWMKDGRDIRVCVIDGPFLDIGLPESLACADTFLKQNWPEGRVS